MTTPIPRDSRLIPAGAPVGAAPLIFDTLSPVVATRPPRFAFLAIGEPHQLFHILGPAISAAQSGHSVTVLVTTAWHERIIARHAARANLKVERLRSLSQEEDTPIFWAPSRLLTLVLNADKFFRFDVMVTPERTSTLLKRFGLFSGMLAHIPHGAGDRAAGYDKRIRHFDCVIVAGEKDRQRMIERGLVAEASCVAGGYAKFDILNAPPPFFGDTKPIVLYNPHFDRKLSSWPAMGPALIKAFAVDDSFNYIIAPHIRMRGTMRRSFENLAAQNTCPHIRFDAGSIHSINMDYTRAASIYLGDVSSQVYEFIQTPRPCVFFNAKHIHWQNDGHFNHWRLGDVAVSVGEAMAFLSDAQMKHRQYNPLQRELFDKAIAQRQRSASLEIANTLLDQYRVWRRGQIDSAMPGKARSDSVVHFRG